MLNWESSWLSSSRPSMLHSTRNLDKTISISVFSCRRARSSSSSCFLIVSIFVISDCSSSFCFLKLSTFSVGSCSAARKPIKSSLFSFQTRSPTGVPLSSLSFPTCKLNISFSKSVFSRVSLWTSLSSLYRFSLNKEISVSSLRLSLCKLTTSSSKLSFSLLSLSTS